MRPRSPSEAILVPWVLVMMVFPHSFLAKMEGAMSLYHSFLVKGSTAFFLPPFFDLVSRLFFPCDHFFFRWRDGDKEERTRNGVREMDLTFGYIFRPTFQDHPSEAEVMGRGSSKSHETRRPTVRLSETPPPEAIVATRIAKGMLSS